MLYLKKIFTVLASTALLFQCLEFAPVLAQSTDLISLEAENSSNTNNETKNTEQRETTEPDRSELQSDKTESEEGDFEDIGSDGENNGSDTDQNQPDPNQFGSETLPDGSPLPAPSSDEIPLEGPGISTPGETTLPNTDNETSTTYYLSENGVYSHSIVNKSTGEIIYIALLANEIPLDNSLKNPILIDLGVNPVTKEKIALSGDERDLALAIPVEIELAKMDGEDTDKETKEETEIETAAIALPVMSGTGLSGSVAINYQTKAPYIQSLYEEHSGSLVVPVQSGAIVQVINNAKTFEDIHSNNSQPNFWTEASDFMSARGLMQGVGSEGIDFDPTGIVTRGQLAMILYRYAGSPEVLGNFPEGVTESDYFSKASIWAVENELMGVGSLFDGYKNLSREELTTILYRYSKGSIVNTNALNRFPDQIIVANWARNGMAWAVENNIVGLGVSELDPRSDGIRIDLAVMIERYIENVVA